uniref:Reverse transcriptase domain-containing protein n=1 Tax=Trichuris muris TaxID=70415 RepID=A0A5S6QM59_TRIMR
MDLIGGLNIRIHGSNVVSNVAVTTSEGRTNAKLRNYVHEVKIKRDIKPVKQKLRRLPLLLREAVAKEIHKLLSTGIIEKIDASEWVSPIVVTRKKDGNIRYVLTYENRIRPLYLISFPYPILMICYYGLRVLRFSLLWISGLRTINWSCMKIVEILQHLFRMWDYFAFAVFLTDCAQHQQHFRTS